MDDKGIKTLVKLLQLKKRKDIADLLSGSLGEISESGQFGSYDHSILSDFLIFSPVEKFYKLRELDKKDKKLILDSVLDIYPPEANAPEITFVEYRILKESGNSTIVSETEIESIEIFLSYSSKDKVVAGEIKSQLDDFGLEAFLAHEDIAPSLEWQEVILQRLESCNIFIPLISQNFKESDWTNQEAGIAFSKRNLIIPLSLGGIAPYGFIGKYQALQVKTKHIEDTCAEIIETIKKHDRFKSVLQELTIKSFLNSNSFIDAKTKSQPLMLFDNFTPEQVNRILEGSIKNEQIWASFGARPNLKELIKKYETVAKQSLINKLLEQFK